MSSYPFFFDNNPFFDDSCDEISLNFVPTSDLINDVAHSIEEGPSECDEEGEEDGTDADCGQHHREEVLAHADHLKEPDHLSFDDNLDSKLSMNPVLRKEEFSNVFDESDSLDSEKEILKDINMKQAYLNEEIKASTDKIKLNNNELLNKKRVFFSKKINKIKGRPKKGEKNNNELIYTHQKDSRDNICQKIKGYLIELSRIEFNKKIKKIGIGKLYKIDANKYTKKIKAKDNLDLLDTPMLTIFKNITKKHNVDPNNNIEIIEKLANLNNNEINNYLEMTFGKFFELATNKNKNESFLEKNIFDVINEKCKNDDPHYKQTVIKFCDVNTYKDFWNNRAS